MSSPGLGRWGGYEVSLTAALEFSYLFSCQIKKPEPEWVRPRLNAARLSPVDGDSKRHSKNAGDNTPVSLRYV